MAVRYEGVLALLDGDCTVEEAGDLAEWLIADAARQVDLAGCRGLHTAVLQTLMALRPPVAAMPADPVLGQWLGRVLPAPVVPVPPAEPAHAPDRTRKPTTTARTPSRRSKKAKGK